MKYFLNTWLKQEQAIDYAGTESDQKYWENLLCSDELQIADNLTECQEIDNLLVWIVHADPGFDLIH